MPQDFYDLLDVDEDASQEEVRAAYRALAREYHPDVNPDDRARDQFQAVKAAHDVLSDPAERSSYDRMGHAAYVHERLDGLPGVETPPPPSTGADADDPGSAGDDGPGSGRREPAAARRAREVASRRRTRLGGLRWYLVAGLVGYLVGLVTLGVAGRPATTALLADLSRTPVATMSATVPAVGAFGAGGLAANPLDVLFPLGTVAVAVGAGAVVREFERPGAWLAFFGTLAPLLAVAAAVGGVTLPTGVVLASLFAAVVGALGLLAAVEGSRRAVSGR